MAEGKQGASPWKDLKNQMYLGSDRFVEEMHQRIRNDQPLQDVPATQRWRPVVRPFAYSTAVRIEGLRRRRSLPDRCLRHAGDGPLR